MVIADKLDCPENDVLRALEYWHSKGILEGNSLTEDAAKEKEKIEMRRLFVMATKHLQKQLTITEPGQLTEYDEMKKEKKTTSTPVKAKLETFKREYDMSALEKQLLNKIMTRELMLGKICFLAFFWMI